MMKRIMIILLAICLVFSNTSAVMASEIDTEQSEQASQEPSGEGMTEPEATGESQTDGTEEQAPSDNGTGDIQTDQSPDAQPVSSEEPSQSSEIPSEEPSQSSAEPSGENGTDPSQDITPTPGYEEGNAEPDVGLEFKIEDRYVYDGMSSSYSQGYIPTVTG